LALRSGSLIVNMRADDTRGWCDVDAAPGAYQGLVEGRILFFFRFYDLDPVTLADRRSACLLRYFVLLARSILSVIIVTYDFFPRAGVHHYCLELYRVPMVVRVGRCFCCHAAYSRGCVRSLLALAPPGRCTT
jgi:hypothetical protein